MPAIQGAACSRVALTYKKEPVLTALSLPENPDELLDRHARALDSAYRDVAGKLGPETEVTVDRDGRLHVSALRAIEDPTTSGPSVRALRTLPG